MEFLGLGLRNRGQHHVTLAPSCRVYTLQRIMDAALDNLNRIRLIWGRLWAALAAHLVAAACHADPSVAVLAVGHMRALVQRLLARSELSCFTHQVESRFCISVLFGPCHIGASRATRSIAMSLFDSSHLHFSEGVKDMGRDTGSSYQGILCAAA